MCFKFDFWIFTSNFACLDASAMTNTLVIPFVNSGHSGNYSCEIDGKATNVVHHLVVLGKQSVNLMTRVVTRCGRNNSLVPVATLPKLTPEMLRLPLTVM